MGRLPGRWAISAPPSIAACARTLLDRGHEHSTPARVFLVPGRIEVLGKHTDYAGGRSLLAAAERGFTLVCVDRPDAIVRIDALDLSNAVEFPISPELRPGQGWSNYPMTVARRLARNFPEVGRGVDVAVHGDLPLASGMSSSSALIIGIFLCLAAANDLASSPRFLRELTNTDDVASYLAATESGQGFGELGGDAGVGTHGGSEDHTAILRGRESTLLQYGFVPAALERTIPMPGGYLFALASSGVHAEKTGAMRERYNRASALARALRDLWNRAGGAPAGSLAAAVRSAPDTADRLRGLLDAREQLDFPSGELIARLDQFVQESEFIVPNAATALADGRIDRFGALVDDSQRLAEGLLGNQIPETIELARSARRLGAAAASAFGAGYGGSVWALVEASSADAFLREWRASYTAAFPGPAERAAFFTSGAGVSARRVG